MATTAYIRQLWQEQFDAGLTDETFAAFLSAYREWDEVNAQPYSDRNERLCRQLEAVMGS